MTRKNPIQLERLIYFWIKTPEKKPLALSLETRKFLSLVSLVTVAFAISIVGTLLFFRELEINRKLAEEVLALRLKDKMFRTAGSTAVKAPDALVNAQAAQVEVPPKNVETSISARLSDLAVECTDGSCTAKVSMVPVKAGVATGTLLMVLETEVVRIGSGSSSGPLRKRFFIYPQNSTRDVLDESTLSTLPKKPFHFSRALQTSNTFNIGTLVRPLALNLYIFDANDTVVHHERKAIEGNGSDVE